MSQLLLQIPNIQLKREQDRENIKAVNSETTRPLCKDETAFEHVIVFFKDATMQHCLCVCRKKFITFRGFTKLITFIFAFPFADKDQQNSYTTFEF